MDGKSDRKNNIHHPREVIEDKKRPVRNTMSDRARRRERIIANEGKMVDDMLQSMKAQAMAEAKAHDEKQRLHMEKLRATDPILLRKGMSFALEKQRKFDEAQLASVKPPSPEEPKKNERKQRAPRGVIKSALR